MRSLYLSFSAVLLAARFADSSPISSKNTGENSIGDIVDLGYAKYQGATNSLGINEFLGLRYAAPPLGELRFRAPRDPLNETGIIKADSVCNPCCERIVYRIHH
jgi:acetylcholinesterase